MLTRRTAIAALLLLALSSLSGCAYLRLLRMKNQMKAFDKHVVVHHEGDKLCLEMIHPVVADGDFVEITGSEPTAKRVILIDPSVEEWDYRFEKVKAAPEHRAYKIRFKNQFDECLLSRITFDPKLLEALPPEFMVTLFRNMGRAKINTVRRSVTARVKTADLPDAIWPTRDHIDAVMGEPTSIEGKRDTLRWRYQFRFYNPEDESIAGQFVLTFLSSKSDPERRITSFELTAKAN